MSIWQALKKLLSGQPLLKRKNEFEHSGGSLPEEKDTLAVIRDLSRVVMHNPDAVDIYLALGNLYRAKGDLERAVQIRETLLIRPELAIVFKARAFFELGQDYRRAGMMDRALNAYTEAEKMGFPQGQIKAELASLYAGSGNWEKASQYYGAIGNKAAEAHFHVKTAQESQKLYLGETKKALRYIDKALRIFPGSPEAWGTLIRINVEQKKWSPAAKKLARALDNIAHEKYLILFEELMNIAVPEDNCSVFMKNMADAFIPVLEKRQEELTVLYFGANLLKRCQQYEVAVQWLSKAVLIKPDFWLGRVGQLEIARIRYNMPPLIDADLEFFISQAQRIKRFICSVCGLNREQLFYHCPRCYSWHSARYKLNLND